MLTDSDLPPCSPTAAIQPWDTETSDDKQQLEHNALRILPAKPLATCLAKGLTWRSEVGALQHTAVWTQHTVAAAAPARRSKPVKRCLTTRKDWGMFDALAGEQVQWVNCTDDYSPG